MNDNGVPRVSIRLVMADEKVTIEREVYTFFTFIGDIGGFNGAILMFPAFFVSRYTAKMYETTIYSELPVK